jgi:hypothetical protein
MKQILLLLTIHLLIFHQYQKDKKEQKYFIATKGAVVIKKEQKDNLNNLLQDLSMNKSDRFLYATGTVTYYFADYSFLFKRTDSKFNGSVQKNRIGQEQGSAFYSPF